MKLLNVLNYYSPIILDPGNTYTFFFETPKDLGTIQSVVFYWEAKIQIFNPFEWIRTDYIYLESNILVTEQDDVVSVFQPARTKVAEEKDLHATLLHSYEQKWEFFDTILAPTTFS